MGRKQRQMLELRSLRNAAKGLLRDDVAFLKGNSGNPSPGARLMQGAGAKARTAADSTAQFAADNRLKIGTGIALGVGALAAWIFRDKIEKAFDHLLAYIEGDGESEQEASDTEDQTPQPTE